MRPSLSVIILCYRGGEDVKKFVEEVVSCLEREIDDWQIILVGNYLEGANDITPHVVRKIAESDERIWAVTKVKKGMMGWDVRSGFAEATGEVMALIDGDGQMTGRDIVRAYRVMRNEGCDMVKTYRVKRHDGLYRRIISRAYNLIFRILFGRFEIRDVNSKPKVITRTAYAKLNLKSDDWFIDAELMIQACRLRLSVIEIPCVFYDLKGRRSFVRFPAVFEFIKNLIVARIKEFLE
jgi:glycosyltransferase involved in cell wall biosynthesis